MRVFIGAVTDSMQYVRPVTAYYEMLIRPGDEKKISSGMRGDVARMSLVDEFLRRKEFDALLMLDLDQLHPKNLLEQLRSHDVDMVSAHYFRRKVGPMLSVVSTVRDGKWPYFPLVDIPTEGLHEIICAGFGCVLMKREVVEAVQKSFPPGSPVFALGPMPEMCDGEHGTFGADYRFFTRARELGYKLWLDASLESAHYCHVLLTRELYEQLRPYQDEDWYGIWGILEQSQRRYNGMDKRWLELRKEQLGAGYNKVAKRMALVEAELSALREQRLLIEGQVLENEQQIKGYDAIPQKKMEVPVYGSPEEAEAALARRGEPPEGIEEDELRKVRQEVYDREAKDAIETISKYNEQPEAAV